MVANSVAQLVYLVLLCVESSGALAKQYLLLLGVPAALNAICLYLSIPYKRQQVRRLLLSTQQESTVNVRV